MTEENAVIRMESFDVDSTLEAVAKERFAMQPPVIAAFRQAAMKGASRLLNLVNNNEAFDKLKPQEQLKVLEMVFDRAYGKSETASSSMTAMHKTGNATGGDHGKQLDQMEERMTRRNKNYPELNKARQARRQQMSEGASPASDDSGGGDILPPNRPQSNSPITRLNSMTVGEDDEVMMPPEVVQLKLRGSAK